MEPDEKETRPRRRQAMQVHQVVTGHDAEGRAVFVRDKQVDGIPIPHLVSRERGSLTGFAVRE
jgi:hypothetical protein